MRIPGTVVWWPGPCAVRSPGTLSADALRRTYLGLNKDIAIAAQGAAEARTSGHRPSISGPELGEGLRYVRRCQLRGDVQTVDDALLCAARWRENK